MTLPTKCYNSFCACELKMNISWMQLTSLNFGSISFSISSTFPFFLIENVFLNNTCWYSTRLVTRTHSSVTGVLGLWTLSWPYFIVSLLPCVKQKDSSAVESKVYFLLWVSLTNENIVLQLKASELATLNSTGIELFVFFSSGAWAKPKLYVHVIEDRWLKAGFSLAT